MRAVQNIREERNMLLDKVKNTKPGKEALEILSYLRETYDSAIDDYKNSLSILGDTTYEDRKHFLLELIQNADDSIYDDKATISFYIYKDGIELRYNEKGFTVEDVIAITGTGSSTKSAKKFSSKTFIGEKGIGFKSVFALAKLVEIESGPWHFTLASDNYIVPKVVDTGVEDFLQGTRVRIFFKDEDSAQIVADELKKLITNRPESFLFLNTLKEFYVYDMRTDTMKENSLKIESGETISLSAQPNNSLKEYKLYEEELEFPEQLVGERWERLGSSQSLMRKLQVAALVNSDSNYGRLFCYLPTEVKLPVPIFLQIDGHLKADRERLHAPELNKWNKYLLTHLPRFLVSSVLAWREERMLADKLADYVPDEAGTDQLSNTFIQTIDLFKSVKWVKTYDGWEKPTYTILASDLWYGWFNQYPQIRQNIEKLFGKKFIHPTWANCTRWKNKWKVYNVEFFSLENMIKAFKNIKLPYEFLKDDEILVKLYQSIISQLNGTVSRYRNKRELWDCGIFPIEGGDFSNLNPGIKKAYWYSGRTRKSFGIESFTGVRIINSEYTMVLNRTSDNDEKKDYVKSINARNTVVKQLLTILEVPELNEDRLLGELQIPFLLENQSVDKEQMKAKYDIFQVVFENYLSKKAFDENYLSDISKLKDFKVFNQDKHVQKISELILPEMLRLEKEDFLYVSSGMNQMLVVDDWLNVGIEDFSEVYLEKYELNKRNLREFLILCGISNGPKFIFKEQKFDSARTFSVLEESLSRNWKGKIGSDYTSQNSVILKKVELDYSTQFLLENGDYFVKLQIAQGIYDVWLKEFKDTLYNLDSIYYRYNPIPGFAQVLYKRYENRRPLIKDTSWAGVNLNQIPLNTINQQLTFPDKALRILDKKGVIYSLQFFELVHENNSIGYHSFFLDSLNIKTMSVNELNSMWRSVGREKYSTLIKATLELMDLGVNLTGLHIYDIKQDLIRPINDFKLGSSQISGVPYIEEQYGEEGKRLGEHLGLLVESEITPLFPIIDKLISGNENNEWKSNNLYHILNQWRSFTIPEKTQILERIRECQQQNNQFENISIVLNDLQAFDKLSADMSMLIHVEVEKTREILFINAAKEIGINLALETGEIVGTNVTELNDIEKGFLMDLLSKYETVLEEDEKERFFSIIAPAENLDYWLNKTMKVEKINKRILNRYDFAISLPFLDRNKNKFYIQHGTKDVEILARLISMLNISTYRSASRDFNEFYDEMIKAKRIKQELVSENLVTSSEKAENSKLENNNKEEQTARNIVEHENQEKIKIFPVTAEEVFKDIEKNLKKEGSENQIVTTEWKVAQAPDGLEERLQMIAENLEESFNYGPEVVEKRKREKTNEKHRNESAKLQDNYGLEPKTFLLSEYDGRCQVCSTQLTLHNGNKYFEIYRITESHGEKWWTDKPFNILSLCPNCHALAKHGGHLDLTEMTKVAQQLINQEIFPEEMEAYHGDYYIVSIVHNGQKKELVMSPQHLHYYASLLLQKNKVEK
ncbi:sacsin N-terminal ATP-binding-like domain-containing protein [Bacillus rhizoplanae]|uniref:sacsin N-terminal ATP-binding-like domain-containing protein n=1 Tax=Bacillus rhizoplanae TaxID=2880966 RepID=UPI003D20E045